MVLEEQEMADNTCISFSLGTLLKPTKDTGLFVELQTNQWKHK